MKPGVIAQELWHSLNILKFNIHISAWSSSCIPIACHDCVVNGRGEYGEYAKSSGDIMEFLAKESLPETPVVNEERSCSMKSWE